MDPEKISPQFAAVAMMFHVEGSVNCHIADP